MRPLQVLLLPLLLGVAWEVSGQCQCQDTNYYLMKQLMNMQLANEEKKRAQTNSGICQTRQYKPIGTRPYMYHTWTSNRAAFNVHNHAEVVGTLGMGEVVVSVNGVEFRTRHNDYMSKKPSSTSGAYMATENIALPDVPPEVTAKATVEEQITEMQAWFEAWVTQSQAPRDYTKYFKPLMCYLETAWTKHESALTDPFDSERHQLTDEGDTWDAILEKVERNSYSGESSLQENLSYLPTKLMRIVNGTDGPQPVLSQLIYRILCHPVSKDIPLQKFKVVDDVGVRLRNGMTMDAYSKNRAARFSLADFNSAQDPHRFSHNIVDEIMEEIPGFDNYQANLKDTAYGHKIFDFKDNTKEKNVGFYHRVYQTTTASNPDVGTLGRRRSFSDPSVFFAATTQDKIEGVTMEGQTMKYTTAIPLEILWLTPLHKWNPYNILYRGQNGGENTQLVLGGGTRDGASAATAFNGTHSNLDFRTPKAFFNGDQQVEGADTEYASWVLDQSGTAREVMASNFWCSLPPITTLGSVRTRYPIAPVCEEGNPIYKEVDALKAMILDENYSWAYYD